MYGKVFGADHPITLRISDPQTAGDLIYRYLMSDKPCMITRFGAFELATMVNYLGVRNGRPSLKKYIKGDAPDWWWNKKLLQYMQSNAGFFPSTPERISQFCELMIRDAVKVDVLGSWLEDEWYFLEELKNAVFIPGLFLEPFRADRPWTKALEGKTVLVIHPFAKTIQSQYLKREKIFENAGILPDFQLRTIKAVQSMGGNPEFPTWFEALEHMKSEIDKVDFDICLLGCGAYGFPLAAYIKDRGKKAVHLGGVLQLLFGIRGNRWEASDYSHEFDYTSLMNEYWTRPNESEKPENADKVEGACYW
jgi:hypothetical protein